MFERLGAFVAKRWKWIILLWIVLAATTHFVAPAWDSITNDGDLAHMPASHPSVRGELLMEKAFPYNRARSQVAFIVARNDGPLEEADHDVSGEIARRFQNYVGAANVHLTQKYTNAAQDAAAQGDRKTARAYVRQAETAKESAERMLNQAIDFGEELIRIRRNLPPSKDPTRISDAQRLAYSYHNRSLLLACHGDTEKALLDRQRATELAPGWQAPLAPVPLNAHQWPLLDVWSPRDHLLAGKLESKDGQAELVVLQFSTEFMATRNMPVLAEIERITREIRDDARGRTRPGLLVEYSGSAAVGGDLLIGAKRSIQHTELFSVVLVVIILIVVYRSPVLIVAPLVTIGLSFWLSTGLIASLTQLDLLPGFGWWELKVFTTTKIFITVILFGAGTDYCLFLIARFREELAAGHDHETAIARSLAGVGDALTASALTTIAGLSMMFFADFDKFKYSGPIIGLCLVVTLCACITFTPALLRAFGTYTFWPLDPKTVKKRSSGPVTRLWGLVARKIVARPGLILVLCVGVLTPLAVYGFRSEANVTYDLASTLPPQQPSRRGATLMREFFEVGESGPITILVQKPGAGFDSLQGQQTIGKITCQLYEPGVANVRSIMDPLGEVYHSGSQHGESFGISPASIRQVVMRKHRRTRDIFVPHREELAGSIARFEVVPKYDPFSPEAAALLTAIDTKLKAQSRDETSPLYGATFSYAGTTAGIRDLRDVTRSDTLRIELLVVLAVFIVLMLILRRPVVCVYMIFSVLLSYYVTIGLTDLFFATLWGDSYTGLDWKAPLFLFVILIAIGQDYNVYLATRVFEEQKDLGPFAGLRRAVAQTGGIITSCGLIMAGTFMSMTSGAWAEPLQHWFAPGSTEVAGSLRGVVEIGFALTLGVLLDTFLVRPVLLPAFLAILSRWRFYEVVPQRPSHVASNEKMQPTEKAAPSGAE